MKEDFLEEVPQGRRNLCGGGREGRKARPGRRCPKPGSLGLKGWVYLGTWLPMTGPDEQERQCQPAKGMRAVPCGVWAPPWRPQRLMVV